MDSGIYEGYEVGLWYDPLLAKVIVWGETRGQAILRMRRALSDYKLLGIRTTIPLHLRLMESTSFIAGRMDTQFLARSTVLESSPTDERTLLAALAAVAVTHHRRQKSAPVVPDGEVSTAGTSAWKLSARPGFRRA